MSSKLPDIVAAVAGDLASPRVVADIDKVIRHLLDLRKIAVSLHGDPTQPPPAVAVAPTAEPQTGGSIKELVDRYRADERSPYKKLRYKTRENYNSLLRRIVDDCGTKKLADLNNREIQRLYDGWKEGGKIAMAHSLATMLRALATFGTSTLEDRECERLSVVLHNMRFRVEKSHSERLTPEHAKAIISKAHEMGLHSIALAQAFQFDCMLQQKDVIGEWVPKSEPGESIVVRDNEKWLHGIRWSEIDKNLILRHATSRGGKPVEVRLSEAPLVKAEFARIGMLPHSGPIIIYEVSGLPYGAAVFRRVWRDVATAAGIPKRIKNMGSRAGNGVAHAAEANQGLVSKEVRATEGAAPSVARH
jgi:hypothetical protein